MAELHLSNVHYDLNKLISISNHYDLLIFPTDDCNESLVHCKYKPWENQSFEEQQNTLLCQKL